MDQSVPGGAGRASRSDPTQHVTLSDLPEAAFLLGEGGELLACNALARHLLGLPGDASQTGAATALASLGGLAAAIERARAADNLPVRIGLEPLPGRLVELSIAAAGPPGTWIALAREGSGQQHVEQRLQRRLAFAQLVTSASASLIRAEPDQLDAAVNDTLGALGRFFGIDRAYVFLIDYEAQTQSNTHEWVAEGVSRESHNLQGLPLDVFPWLFSLLQRDEAMCLDRVADLPPDAVSERREFEREGIQSVLVVPMWHGQRLRGFVGFDAVRQAVTWDSDCLVALRLLAQMLAGVLEAHKLAQRLRALAFHDYLTGLPNRVLMEDRLEVALQRIQRKPRSLWLAMVDLDGFKQVNDTWGHAAGDEVLRVVARRLQSVLRQGDTVARLGGDEFVLIIEDEDEQSAHQIGSRLLAAFDAPVPVAGETVRIGLSIGLARAVAGRDRPGELMRRADAAMYRAKSAGKNGWAVDSPVS